MLNIILSILAIIIFVKRLFYVIIFSVQKFDQIIRSEFNCFVKINYIDSTNTNLIFYVLLLLANNKYSITLISSLLFIMSIIHFLINNIFIVKYYKNVILDIIYLVLIIFNIYVIYFNYMNISFFHKITTVIISLCFSLH